MVFKREIKENGAKGGHIIMKQVDNSTDINFNQTEFELSNSG